jgi:hypothetical protein
METLRKMWSVCMADNNPILGLFQFCFLLAVLLFPAVCVLDMAALAVSPTYRYSISYHVPYSNVTIEPEPQDCEFLRAPIGGKGCHYRRVVQKTDGQVYVSWELETDEQAEQRRLAQRAAQAEAEQAREKEFKERMTQVNRDEVARRAAEPEEYSNKDVHGVTCLPHQRRENERHEFVCQVENPNPNGQVRNRGQE